MWLYLILTTSNSAYLSADPVEELRDTPFFWKYFILTQWGPRERLPSYFCTGFNPLSTCLLPQDAASVKPLLKETSVALSWPKETFNQWSTNLNSWTPQYKHMRKTTLYRHRKHIWVKNLMLPLPVHCLVIGNDQDSFP